MSLMGISNIMSSLPGYNMQQNNQTAAKVREPEEVDIDKKENGQLEFKMSFAETKSDADASYFGALQEALKDSNDGFEAYRRVNKLMSTHDKAASSEEYKKKLETKCLVKDLVDSMEEKRKELEKIIEKRKEREEAEGLNRDYDEAPAADVKADIKGDKELENEKEETSENNPPINFRANKHTDDSNLYSGAKTHDASDRKDKRPFDRSV